MINSKVNCANKTKDEPQTQRPRQLRLLDFRRRGYPVPYISRFHLRNRHHRLSHPPRPPLYLHDLHWACVWVEVIAIGGNVYVFHGRKHYAAPVIFVEGRRLAGFQMQGTECSCWCIYLY